MIGADIKGQGGRMDSAEPQYPTRPERPTSVTVIAIIAIVLGALVILCCTPMGILPFVSDAGGPNPVVQMTKAKPLLFIWTIFQQVVGFLLAVVMVTGGIGSLSLKSWGRLLLMGEAAISILLNVVGMIVSLVVFVPLMRGMGSGPESTGIVAGIGVSFCFVLLTMAYKAVVLFFMTRPNVKAAFGA